MLKSYISGINSWIGPKRYSTYYFSGNIVNEQHDWIYNHPNVIQSPNVSDSICGKVNGTHEKKQKNLLQISVRDLNNGIILPVYQDGFYDARSEDGKLCIGDTSLTK